MVWKYFITRIEIANLHWNVEKQSNYQNISFLVIVLEDIGGASVI